VKCSADVRRALALLPDARQHELALPFAELAAASGLPTSELAQLLVGYLFDRSASAILATSESRATWIGGPLFIAVGPGNGAFANDVIAALIAAPILAKGGALSAAALEHRFAPRADDAIAIAVSALPAERRAAVLEALFAPVGDPDRQLLATVQCGRVVAWSPALLDTPIGARVVTALLELLAPAQPKPLLDEVARALGPIAASTGALAQRVRDAAFAVIDAATQPHPISFAAEVAAIGKARTVPDQDRWLALAAREAATAAAYILGVAAPLERDAFGAHRALVLDRPDPDGLLEGFLAGLVAGAHIPAATELASTLLHAGGEASAMAFTLAAALPLDGLADELVAELDSPSPDRRALACSAVELLAGADLEDDRANPSAVDQALAARLGDPSPDVAAAAAHGLLARGRRDLIVEHAQREPHALRRAIANAALGDLSVPVIGELVRAVLRANDPEGPEGEAPGVSPLARFTTQCLLATGEGLEVLAELIGGIPEAAGLFALTVIDEVAAERDIAVLAPPGPRARLATAALHIATDPEAGAELGTLALGLLAHISAGDVTLADVIADALTETDGYAANLIAALGELRVATPRAAAAIAALVAPSQPLGARIMAASISGRTLPHDHPAWQDVRALGSLGTVARAAAWAGLRDRARRP
jgi:hypothetical protein